MNLPFLSAPPRSPSRLLAIPRLSQAREICVQFTRGVDFNWQAQALLALQEVRRGPRSSWVRGACGRKVALNLTSFILFYLCIIYLFWPRLQHVEVPKSRAKDRTQTTAVTQAAAVTTPAPSPAAPQRNASPPCKEQQGTPRGLKGGFMLAGEQSLPRSFEPLEIQLAGAPCPPPSPWSVSAFLSLSLSPGGRSVSRSSL